MRGRAVKRAVGAVLFAAALLWCGGVSAQQHPERRHLRAGNRSYEAQEYAAGAEAFREALAKEPSSFAAAFNLADALYKQGDYAGAAEVLGALAERSDLTPGQRAKVFHNLGNDMFAQQKLKEAVDFYKQSLRENPADLETKYNLAYVQKLLEEQQQQEGGGGDDRNQNQNQDQNGNQNRDGSGNNAPEEDGNRDEGGNDRPDDRNGSGGDDGSDDRDDGGGSGDDSGPKEESREQETPGGMSREDAENILDAMQQQEDRTREKVNAQRAVGVARSGKNW